MVDFRVDDGFGTHPKTLGMTHEAVGVWMLMGCWCARYLTDGYIPDDAVRTITGRSRVVQDLAQRNLITRLADGWQFVDWTQYQRTREQVEKDRTEARERMRDLRNRRREP
jgi:hypothetical protein